MALTRCRDCGKKISTEAAVCPHCGAPPPLKGDPQPPPTRPGSVARPSFIRDPGPAFRKALRECRDFKRWRKALLTVLIFALLWFVVVVMPWFDSHLPTKDAPPTATSTPAKAPSRELQRSSAISACQVRVQSGLKAPSTAKFPGPLETDVRDKGADLAVVISYVDAQNSFGAMIRTRWICEVNVSDWENPIVQKVVVEGQR